MVQNRKITDKELNDLPIVGDQPRSEKEEKFLKEVCEFEFYNLEESGLCLKFPYGNTQKHTDFLFFHGGKYKIPRHVARHVDSRCTPKWEWRPNGKGTMEKQKIGLKPRFQMKQIYG